MVTLLKGLKPPMKPAAAPAATQPPAATVASPVAPIVVSTKPAIITKPNGGGLKFLKRGAEAQALMQQEEKKAEMRAAARDRDQIRRYWIPAGGNGCVTFLDGNLKDGVLDIPYYYEHQELLNGHRRNWFVCTQDEEPCPLCEGGSNAQYVGLLTVIDHSEFTGKDNKVYKDQVRLFAAKKDTIKLLQTYAVKRGGLRGCKFDVVRVGDKSANVGSGFDFTEKYSDAQLKQMYKEASNPINYEQYLTLLYQPAEELRKLGFGSMSKPIGSETAPAEGYEV
jgi:hypothetical protein